MFDDASYVCDACGEEIVVPFDGGFDGVQEYVEDCPVCCRPMILTVHLDPDGSVSISARAE